MARSSLDDAARRLARLHAEHYERRSRLQRFIEGLKDRAAQPWMFCLISLCLAAWIGLHVHAALSGSKADVDPNWMQIALGFAALAMTSLILTGQRQDESLEEQRSQLTLQMITLIERRLARAFPESGKPTQPEQALDALERAHREESDKPLAD